MPVPDTKIREKLAHIAPGRIVKIEGITDLLMAKRMFAMGLLPGTTITVVRRAPLSGACYIKSGVLSLALRKQEAELIEVV